MCSCRTQKRPAFPGYSCSNESGNSGTEQGCQLACSAIRLKHGCAGSLRPRELDVTSRSDESRKTNRKPGPPTNWTGSSIPKCWNQSRGRQLCTQSNLREFAASYPLRATTDCRQSFPEQHRCNAPGYFLPGISIRMSFPIP